MKEFVKFIDYRGYQIELGVELENDGIIVRTMIGDLIWTNWTIPVKFEDDLERFINPAKMNIDSRFIDTEKILLSQGFKLKEKEI